MGRQTNRLANWNGQANGHKTVSMCAEQSHVIYNWECSYPTYLSSTLLNCPRKELKLGIASNVPIRKEPAPLVLSPQPSAYTPPAPIWPSAPPSPSPEAERADIGRTPPAPGRSRPPSTLSHVGKQQEAPRRTSFTDTRCSPILSVIFNLDRPIYFQRTNRRLAREIPLLPCAIGVPLLRSRRL